MGRFGVALVGLLLLLALGGCSLGTQSDATGYNPNAINAKRIAFRDELTAALAKPLGAEVDLASLTDVQWDRVCSFYGGASYEFVNERVGAEVLPGEGQLYSQHYLVFTHGGQATFHVELSEQRMSFDLPDTESCITREEALFRIMSLEGVSSSASYNRYLARVK